MNYRAYVSEAGFPAGRTKIVLWNNGVKVLPGLILEIVALSVGSLHYELLRPRDYFHLRLKMVLCR